MSGGKTKHNSCLGKNMSFKNSCVLENACWFFCCFQELGLETELGCFNKFS